MMQVSVDHMRRPRHDMRVVCCNHSCRPTTHRFSSAF